MCSHYEPPKDPNKLKERFKVGEFSDGMMDDMWPGYMGAFIRKHEFADVGDEAVPEREALLGSFGLIPHWAKDTKIARNTYNARSETVSDKPSYRDAWRANRKCIIPAAAIFEPDWRTGKAVPARIARADGEPMGIAGLWSTWRSPAGEVMHSYTMLTINADAHPLMKLFHKPNEEKRMVVILHEDGYSDWLNSSRDESRDFLLPYPAELLHAEHRKVKEE